MESASYSVTLNIPCDLPPGGWAALATVYEAMPGWVAGTTVDGCPVWRPDGTTAGTICVSAEPSGLLISGDVGAGTWQRWLAEFCQRATIALGFPVHDAEE